MTVLSALPLLSAAILLIATSTFLRILYILPSTNASHNPYAKTPKKTPSHMVIVLGSGGHTAEMISILRDTNPRLYKHRTYIVSSGDSFSANKAMECERRIQARARSSRPTLAGQVDSITGKWEVQTVPRAREVHQPLYTTPLSSLWCLIGCLRVLRNVSRTSMAAPGQYPDAIITNGPATAVIVIMAGMILKFFGFAPVYKMKSLYVESWARVKTLSLSGKVLLWLGICDVFMVQWEQLAKKINGNGFRKKVEWTGFLVE
ncbi:hypothetical protein B7494_g6592 [Chlorociboria aeruginascens]|nr:hypothetical protein B7494_g6592 [Chlorociboria aeruginascens]